MKDCVFCNIVDKTLQNTQILYENENLVVVRDILPQAPVHLLVISKHHLESITALEPEHQALVGEMVFVAKQMAEKFNVSGSGYKLIFNVGPDGGQVIPHLHLHLLGGKKME